MNETLKTLIEERSLQDIANALEIAVKALDEIRKDCEYGSTAYEALRQIQAIAEGGEDE